jgi:tetraprenyl-beta-curcumene synthase
MSAFRDPQLAIRATAALAVANARFWPTVAPLVTTQLGRWEQRAGQIDDPLLGALARAKLREERFNAEVAATLATLAPSKHRTTVVEAIVACEIIYDYLDGLVEIATPYPIAHGRQVYRALSDAVAVSQPPTGSYYQVLSLSDGGYLEELVHTARNALRRLPRTDAITAVAAEAVRRCAEAQTRAHATTTLGTQQLQRWAATETRSTPFSWQEFLAGAASSILTVHALIQSAAKTTTTTADAQAIDNVYLSIAVLSTLLDSLVDYREDTLTGQLGYIHLYTDQWDLIAQHLTRSAARALKDAQTLPNKSHHIMTLTGVVAYYSSAPGAHDPHAKPAITQLHSQLTPVITPTLAIMHAWRTAKTIRAGKAR